MSFIEHLGELRKRIIWVLVVFVLATIAGLFVADPIILYLKTADPLPNLNWPLIQYMKNASIQNVDWHVFSPWDGIRIYMQFAFAVGLVISLPFTLFQLWIFVKPGLRESEQKASLRYIPYAVLLFLIGLSFAYFVVFPMALYFTQLMTTRLELQQTYGVTQYISFMFNIILPISLLFEMPIIVMFLTRLRLLNPYRLGKLRRYAYVILLVIGAIITPPDMVSAIIVTIPLIILYEFSVALSRVIYRKQQQHLE